LIKLIQLKFGAVPENLEKVIYECKGLEELDKILIAFICYRMTKR
jgi:hypothetical protein